MAFIASIAIVVVVLLGEVISLGLLTLVLMGGCLTLLLT